MNKFFTIEGKVSEQFVDPVSKHLYRVLHNSKDIQIIIKDRKSLEYEMMMRNIPEIQILCKNHRFNIKIPQHPVPEFEHIGGVNY